jgi:hypothetical protein
MIERGEKRERENRRYVKERKGKPSGLREMKEEANKEEKRARINHQGHIAVPHPKSS